ISSGAMAPQFTRIIGPFGRRDDA
ncbi:MAG: hypothetical protein JWM74_5155, partial [Myxococcaceae bacterium]|nr:hypothetical protein [Myxococcaceae bacterium]